MSKSDGEKVVEEIVEHMIMEKKGILKGHHFLPKKKKSTSKKSKATKIRFEKESDFWFFFLMAMVIGGEIWLIYKQLME